MAVEAGFSVGRQLMADPLAVNRAGILIIASPGVSWGLWRVMASTLVRSELRLGGGDVILWWQFWEDSYIY